MHISVVGDKFHLSHQEIVKEFQLFDDRNTAKLVSLDEVPESDLLVLLDDKLTDYVERKARIPGRPWVFALVTRGSDLLACNMRYGQSRIDWGIDAMLCSSPHYVAQAPAIANTSFMWRPLVVTNLGKSFQERPYLFGSIVDQVGIQDFSLACRVASKVKPKDFCVICHKADEQYLPEVLRPYIRNSEGLTSYESLYGLFSFLVPTPSVMDYRVGVMPFEYVQAVAHGCWPMLVSHPVIHDFEKVVGGYTSLASVDNLIESARSMREVGGRLFGLEEATSFSSTPADFVFKVITAYKRGKSSRA